MEAFSLLRYRRTNGVDATKNDNLITPTAIVTAVSSETSETEDDDDHGPFFDLEFSLPGNEIGVQEHVKNCEEEEEDSDESEEEDDESELKLTSLFQSGSSTGVSVSDDLFGFVPVEEIKSNPPQSRATKLRVMILKLKKSKLKTTDVNIVENEESGKFKAEVVSLFKSSKQKKPQNDNETVSSDDKKFTKKQEYLRKVKPLYVGVSKLKFTGQLIKIPNSVQKQSQVANTKRENESQTSVLGLKQGNLPAGLRKSRSAITAAPPGPICRDDSLIQQQDGIQSAILHCKRSFKASRDSDCSSSSASEPGR